MDTSSTLNKAVELYKQGLSCFPCLESKKPACPGGFKVAAKSLDEVYKLWEFYPGSLIGVPTGRLNNIDVLDIDPRNDGDVWLSKHIDNLPVTRKHLTRSGGFHYIFQHDENLRNSAGKLGSGVDVRGEGGYVIWWPAHGYEVGNCSVLSKWPEWALNQLKCPNYMSRKAAHQSLDHYSQAYIRSSLSNAVRSISTAPEGCRNTVLNKEMFSMLRFVESGDIATSQIAEALARAALDAGLEKQETISTIASALRARGFQ